MPTVRQGDLFDSVTVPVPVDPNVPQQHRERLTGCSLAMYQRLLEGPATEDELRAAGAGKRAAARRLDINAWLERQGSEEYIPLGEMDDRGVCTYRLEIPQTKD